MSNHGRPTEVRTTTNRGELRCPACGGTYMHVDQVAVAARHEDGPFNNIAVYAISGRVSTHDATPAMGTAVGLGRRHRIVLVASCEMCGAEPELVFTQHKGLTHVEWTNLPTANASEED